MVCGIVRKDTMGLFLCSKWSVYKLCFILIYLLSLCVLLIAPYPGHPTSPQLLCSKEWEDRGLLEEVGCN